MKYLLIIIFIFVILFSGCDLKAKVKGNKITKPSQAVVETKIKTKK